MTHHERTNCYYCGIPTRKVHIGKGEVPPDNMRTVEHILPKARGGKGRHALKVIACRKCNEDKHCLTLEEYRAVIAVRKGLLKELIELKFYGELHGTHSD